VVEGWREKEAEFVCSSPLRQVELHPEAQFTPVSLERTSTVPASHRRSEYGQFTDLPRLPPQRECRIGTAALRHRADAKPAASGAAAPRGDEWAFPYRAAIAAA
jgi:hypothetical protein